MNNSIISTVNWNDFKKTSRCIKSLINSNSTNCDFVLVDNYSNNDEYFKLLKFLKEITSKNRINFQNFNFRDYTNLSRYKKNFFLIKSPLNTGCTGGYNIAYDFAVLFRYKYVVRIDNDCEVSKNFLFELTNFMDQNQNYVGINSKVCYMQNKEMIQWVGCRINNNLKFHRSMRPFKKQRSLEENRPDLNSKKWIGLAETDALNGPGSLIRVEVFKKSGLASSDFFFGPEDIELSFRLKKFGKIGVMLDSEIYHEVAQSAKKELTFGDRKYKEFKSYLILIKKIGSFWDKIIGYGYFYLKLNYFLFFNYSEFKILFKALTHFILKKYGKFDIIKNNSKVNNLDIKIKNYYKILV
jgi:GT2 family glycosyltransferase